MSLATILIQVISVHIFLFALSLQQFWLQHQQTLICVTLVYVGQICAEGNLLTGEHIEIPQLSLLGHVPWQGSRRPLELHRRACPSSSRRWSADDPLWMEAKPQMCRRRLGTSWNKHNVTLHVNVDISVHCWGIYDRSNYGNLTILMHRLHGNHSFIINKHWPWSNRKSECFSTQNIPHHQHEWTLSKIQAFAWNIIHKHHPNINAGIQYAFNYMFTLSNSAYMSGAKKITLLFKEIKHLFAFLFLSP